MYVEKGDVHMYGGKGLSISLSVLNYLFDSCYIMCNDGCMYVICNGLSIFNIYS